MSSKRGKCIFNADLAKKYPFIKKDQNKSESDVKCDLCRAEFNISNKGKTGIEHHIATSKHQKALQVSSSSHSIKNMFSSSVNYSLAACEGAWVYHLINSNHSFLSSDCTSKLLRTCFEIQNFHCGRTKSEAIATNVFAPFAEKVLGNDLSERHYICLSTDASNHGNIKLMPVVVRYFIPTVGIKVKMLEFSSEKGETSDIISSLIMKTAQKYQITDKIVGFCGDNCPTNFGSCERGGENNVFYRLKMQLKSELIGIGCGAHIGHNTLKHACDCLPIDVECVVVKIYTHFYINTVRVEALKAICELSEGVEYSQLLGYAKTRFLALGPAIGSIINVYEPLKDYFLNLQKCPTIIKSLFESPLSKLWLFFVKEQVKFF